jgi:hypothetical protein
MAPGLVLDQFAVNSVADHAHMVSPEVGSLFTGSARERFRSVVICSGVIWAKK